MRNCKLFLVIAAIVVQASTAAAQMATGISWQTDLDAARGVAEKEQKLLLIHFYNNSCGPCQMLEARVFNQPTVAGAVHSHYVPVKLNTDEFPATAERFGIVRIPTDVVITPQGQVIQRLTSPGTPMAYIKKMTGIASEHQAQAARSFATAPTGDGMTQPVNSAYSGLPVAGDTNSYTASAPTGLTDNPYAQPSAPATNNSAPAAPTTSQPAVEPPTVAASPVEVNNPYAMQPVTPVQPAESTPPTANYSAAPPAPAATTTASAAPTQVAAAQPTAPQAEAPQLPPGSHPLGFFGCCPVSMKQNEGWQKGDVRWGCYHRGRTYLFTSAEKRDTFLADPDVYAPALSGIDPVLAIDANQAVPGKQEFGIEYDDKFYLFSSEQNLRKFYSQPQRYADGVRQAMLSAPAGRLLK